MSTPPSPKRVLFCRSNPIAPDPRVEKEARSLVKAGYDVAVIAWDRSGSLPPREERDGFIIHRAPIRASYAAGMMNLPHLLRWELALFTWLCAHHREYDIIHACDFDTILPALWARALFRKKVVYDIFDFYADHLRRTPGWIKNLIRWRDLRAIDQSDALIICDDARTRQISGSHPRRMAVIYNSPEDHVPQLPDNTPPAAASGSLRIAYIGLIQVERGLLEMLAALKNHPEWRLDLAGFGGDQERVLAAAQNMPNVTWHGRVLYDRALELSQAADLLFALYEPTNPNHRYSSPNKVFEALMLAKPILVAAGTNMDQIIERAQCGRVVPYGDIPAIEAALSELAADPALRHELGCNARRAYESGYAWNIMEARLLALYRDIYAA